MNLANKLELQTGELIIGGEFNNLAFKSSRIQSYHIAYIFKDSFD